MKLIVTDFDGTLTTSDSMFRIIVFHRGRWWLYANLLLLSPLILLMFLGVYSNQRTKEKLLYRCFGNICEEDFQKLCEEFAMTHHHILRQDLYQNLLEQKRQGKTVIVITASPEQWVKSLVPEFQIIGTKMEFSAKGFTGSFLTPNCYGQEKVNRLLQAYPDLTINRSHYHITAYGDSKGDKQMLEFADEATLINDVSSIQSLPL